LNDKQAEKAFLAWWGTDDPSDPTAPMAAARIAFKAGMDAMSEDAPLDDQRRTAREAAEAAKDAKENNDARRNS
jgi:hypothetical protein